MKRTWSCKRIETPNRTAMWQITTPDDTLIFIHVWSEADEGRAQFIVDACNAAEAKVESE